MIWLRIPNFGEFHFLKRGLNNLNYCCSNAVDQKTTFLACIEHIFLWKVKSFDECVPSLNIDLYKNSACPIREHAGEKMWVWSKWHGIKWKLFHFKTSIIITIDSTLFDGSHATAQGTPSFQKASRLLVCVPFTFWSGWKCVVIVYFYKTLKFVIKI